MYCTYLFLKALFLALILSSCSAFNDKVGLSDDNPIEEFMEAALERKTGVNLDFTPRSPEK